MSTTNSSSPRPVAADRVAAVSAQVVLPCSGDLDATLAFFTDSLGFRVEAIFPADRPTTAVVDGYGLRLRLDTSRSGDAGTLRLLCHEPDRVAGGARELTAPNGTRIEIEDADPPLLLPPLAPSLVVTDAGGTDEGVAGRAGMIYRDLLPGRQGGMFVASRISIPGGGPVPDYVHFHKVRFQMIFCAAGWVRVAYEDQGEPILMRAGDCVVQPPLIRHRVLEASPGLEVVEVGCPAVHETFGDLALTLPTGRVLPERDFGGQRFVHHVAAGARWSPWRRAGFEQRDTGIGAATGGVAGVRVVRPAASGIDAAHQGVTAVAGDDTELQLWVVLAGEATFRAGDRPQDRLGRWASVTVPPGMAHELSAPTPDFEMLEVTLPEHPGRPTT